MVVGCVCMLTKQFKGGAEDAEVPEITPDKSHDIPGGRIEGKNGASS